MLLVYGNSGRVRRPHDNRDFIKGYQNDNGVSQTLTSVNCNVHYIVSEHGRSGEVRKLCMSGRSSRFTVFDLMMVR